MLQADTNLSVCCLLAGLLGTSPLAAVAADPGPSASSTTSTSTSLASAQVAPTAATNGFEVDIIYPRSNTTYNLTSSLNIVFAFQNISRRRSASQSHGGHFVFAWGITPYGKVGGEQEPGGVFEDSWTWDINAAPSLPDPYILVNNTNVTKWSYGPYCLDGSVYQLQYDVSWVPDNTECSGNIGGNTGVRGIFPNINLGDPEPDLLDVPECIQLGEYIDLSTNSSTSCLAPSLDAEAGNPCDVKVDQAMASSISSVAQYSATATLTSTSTVPTPASTKIGASAFTAPAQSMLVLLVVFAPLELPA